MDETKIVNNCDIGISQKISLKFGTHLYSNKFYFIYINKTAIGFSLHHSIVTGSNPITELTVKGTSILHCGPLSILPSTRTSFQSLLKKMYFTAWCCHCQGSLWGWFSVIRSFCKTVACLSECFFFWMCHPWVVANYKPDYFHHKLSSCLFFIKTRIVACTTSSSPVKRFHILYCRSLLCLHTRLSD